MKFQKNMKAQADIIYIITMVFAVAISFFVVVLIWHGLTASAPFQQLTNATTQGKAAVHSVNTGFGIFADAIVFGMILSFIASLMAAAVSSSSPIFAVLMFIILPVEILFSFIFHDVFFSIMQSSFFSGMITAYPVIFTMFQYLPLITFGFALIIIIVTFGK